jgi:hypothetical protein
MEFYSFDASNQIDGHDLTLYTSSDNDLTIALSEKGLQKTNFFSITDDNEICFIDKDTGNCEFSIQPIKQKLDDKTSSDISFGAKALGGCDLKFKIYNNHITITPTNFPSGTAPENLMEYSIYFNPTTGMSSDGIQIASGDFQNSDAHLILKDPITISDLGISSKPVAPPNSTNLFIEEHSNSSMDSNHTEDTEKYVNNLIEHQ